MGERKFEIIRPVAKRRKTWKIYDIRPPDMIIRNSEVDEMLGKLEGKDVIKVTYKRKYKGELITEEFTVNAAMIQCLIALLWLFGRRISEVLKLHRRHFWIMGKYLYVRFPIRKRRSPTTEYSTKRILIDNPYVKYILNYINKLSLNDPLFPDKGWKRIVKIKVKHKRYGQITKYPKNEDYYIYIRDFTGYLPPDKAWKIIKFLNPKITTHFFRHSVATILAEYGCTEYELMAWFDWDSPQTAHKYVKRGTRLIERISQRTW